MTRDRANESQWVVQSLEGRHTPATQAAAHSGQVLPFHVVTQRFQDLILLTSISILHAKWKKLSCLFRTHAGDF